MNYKTIKLKKDDLIFTITLNKPQVHNALDEMMITELNEVLDFLYNEDFRILILEGEGKSFCSGADLNYMKKMKNFSFEENKTDALNLANLFYKLYFFPKPTIAIGKGFIMGGGIGLIACCDFSICEKNTKFSFSEIRLGLIPSIISPYILRKLGFSRTKELFLTGKIFSSEEAENWGLITKSCEEENITTYKNLLINQLLQCPPQAYLEIKKLLEINLIYDLGKLKDITSKIIAEIRIKEEAQEGINAFFEKRKPNWYKEIKYEDP